MDGFDLTGYLNNSVSSALQSVSNSVFLDAMQTPFRCERAVIPNVNIENTYKPKQIIKSGDHTIVFWPDGTKTIVKRSEDEPDNDYAAFTAALGIKIFGSNSALRRIIKKKTKVQAKK